MHKIKIVEITNKILVMRRKQMKNKILLIISTKKIKC